MIQSILNLPQATRNLLLEAILVSDRMGINITDGHANVLFINDYHFHVTGHPKSEYFNTDGTGKNMRELVENGVVTNSASLLVLEKRDAVDIRQSSSAGKTFQIHAIPIFNEEGEILLVLNMLTDLTEYVDLAAKYREVSRKNERLEQAMNRERVAVFASRTMRDLMDQTKAVAKTEAPVLVSGPTGSGKRNIVELLHKNSLRADKPLIVVSCSGVPENTLEQNLFGYAAGAVPGGSPGGMNGAFEEAAGGTLLLDGIGGMPRSLQARLLKVLRENVFNRIGSTRDIPVDFRLVCATNMNLKEEGERKNFLLDLYYEISIVELKVPSLQERREDIPLLVDSFLEYFNTKYGRHRAIEREAMKMLCQNEWEGNVRELQNVVERLVIRSEEPLITAQETFAAMGILSGTEGGHGNQIDFKPGASLHEMMEEYEKRLLTEYASMYRNGTELAKRLQTDQSTISRKLKKYSIKQ